MTFLMIFLAELGDKTQLAVVTMSTTHDPISVWLGATVALIMTSGLGIFAGRKILTRLQPELLHKVSGLLFIGVGSVMLAKLLL
jgi:putative Ca2+/H+ antiporter (TMEM165/GDT1 family)